MSIARRSYLDFGLETIANDSSTVTRAFLNLETYLRRKNKFERWSSGSKKPMERLTVVRRQTEEQEENQTAEPSAAFLEGRENVWGCGLWASLRKIKSPRGNLLVSVVQTRMGCCFVKAKAINTDSAGTCYLCNYFSFVVEIAMNYLLSLPWS